MGPTERGLRSVLDLVRAGGYDPKGGRPVPIEELYAANTVTYAQFQAILRETEDERRNFARARDAGEIGAESDALAERLRAAGFPPRFTDSAIDKTRIAELASGRWVCVQGLDVEVVTRRAAAVAKGWLSTNPFGSVRFVRSTTMASSVIGDGARDFMSQMTGAGLLVLSGLGSESASAWVTSKLWELLDVRYGNAAPMVVTTRHRPDELARHLGERADDETVRGIIDLLRRQSVMLHV